MRNLRKTFTLAVCLSIAILLAMPGCDTPGPKKPEPSTPKKRDIKVTGKGIKGIRGHRGSGGIRGDPGTSYLTVERRCGAGGGEDASQLNMVSPGALAIGCADGRRLSGGMCGLGNREVVRGQGERFFAVLRVSEGRSEPCGSNLGRIPAESLRWAQGLISLPWLFPCR